MTYAIDRDYTVSVTDNGVPLYFGRAGLGDASSAYVFQFVPNQDGCDAAFAVMGCVFGSPGAMATSGTDPNSPFTDTSFVPVPFRLGYANGAPQNWVMTDSVATPLSGKFLIQVPANGLKIALMPAVNSGTGVLWSQSVTGGTAP